MLAFKASFSCEIPCSSRILLMLALRACFSVGKVTFMPNTLSSIGLKDHWLYPHGLYPTLMLIFLKFKWKLSMRKIIFCFFFLTLSSGFSNSSELTNQSCLSVSEQSQTRLMPMADGTLAQQVMCCCNTYPTGQMCCNFQARCNGLVRGCVCDVQNQPDSEIENNPGSSIKG